MGESFRLHKLFLCLLVSLSVCFQHEKYQSRTHVNNAILPANGVGHHTFNAQPPKSMQMKISNNNEEEESERIESLQRRYLFRAMASTGFLAVASPTPCFAGEVGARITKAVTTSDLGISVRTSVVKGAQMMDQLDGRWEKFSDTFGLGSERSEQDSRPKPKQIPDPLPLDASIAQKLLDISDKAFCTQTGISSQVLKDRIEKVANLVKISFERSGLAFVDIENPLRFESSRQNFNFVVYCHFKAYSLLILEQNIPFRSFRPKFEAQVGQQVVSLLLPSYYDRKSNPNPPAEDNDTVKRESLRSALSAIDELGTVLTSKGLAALVERIPINDDQIYDWLDGTANLEFTVALDLDSTLNAQILLQEQGYRLYPNYARYAVAYLLNQVAADQKVSVIDYYFDTNYNSDPELFEVKEILISVIMENI